MKTKLTANQPKHRQLVDEQRAPRTEKSRIREPEKALRRKDKALAEMAALLVLQEKLSALQDNEEDNQATNYRVDKGSNKQWSPLCAGLLGRRDHTPDLPEMVLRWSAETRWAIISATIRAGVFQDRCRFLCCPAVFTAPW